MIAVDPIYALVHAVPKSIPVDKHLSSILSKCCSSNRHVQLLRLVPHDDQINQIQLRWGLSKSEIEKLLESDVSTKIIFLQAKCVFDCLISSLKKSYTMNKIDSQHFDVKNLEFIWGCLSDAQENGCELKSFELVGNCAIADIKTIRTLSLDISSEYVWKALSTSKTSENVFTALYDEDFFDGTQRSWIIIASDKTTECTQYFNEIYNRSLPEIFGLTQIPQNYGSCPVWNVEAIRSWSNSITSKFVNNRFKSAISTITEAIEKYGPENIAFSYNGGKDCTALVHLTTLALIRYFDKHNALQYYCEKFKLKTVYILPNNTFPEVEEFAEKYARLYRLELIRLAPPMKEGLGKFLDIYPHIKAIYVGTRSTDPYASHLKAFSPTDNGWPSFMRVNPILDWKYSDVWDYLLQYDVGYCSLYEKGYTSLGSQTNTLPNPHLKNPSKIDPKKGIYGYDAAWMLNDEDGKLERAGRL